MVSIIFEVHATTFDNELQRGSGHSDVDLSPTGVKQAEEMRARYAGKNMAAVFCSDLKRSTKTAEIAFSGTGVTIVSDSRLRECDYGDYTRKPSAEIKKLKVTRIDTPFPDGQSYAQTTDLAKRFLKDLKINYDGKTVLVIGHAATQYALEHLLKGVSLRDAIEAPWAWQPGWFYELNEL